MKLPKFGRFYTGMLLLAVSASLCALDEELKALTDLKHNPFLVPAFVQAPAAAPSVEVASKNMAIRGVLISEKGTLVNINGSILGLNEFIDDYKLVSLDDGKAVLTNNEQEIVLPFPTTSNGAGRNRLQHSRPDQ